MFIQPNKTKAKLKAGQPAFGVIATSDDPQLAELFGIAGFDYYMLDAEHGLIDPVQAVNVIRACESTNITPMVRIGSKDPKLRSAISGCRHAGNYDAGLETVEEVKMLVDAVKYAPVANADWDSHAPRVIWLYTAVAPNISTFRMSRQWSLFNLKMTNFSKYSRLCAVKDWMHASSVRATFP
jgi:2-keto-3-deoxy-L-rhamnonate aldolase RhmA